MTKCLTGSTLSENGLTLAHSLRAYSPLWRECAVGGASQREWWVLVHVRGDQEAELDYNI